MIVSRKAFVAHLLGQVKGDWKQSKLAAAVSYWQTKIIEAKT